ncbi:MAG: 4-hydroxy-tetrahydrodipicolinate synthase, partial [Flavobacteriaceae bacterium TMED208]
MNLKGLGVAMVTPFDSNGNIDFQSIPTIVENISTGRANYIVIMGTTAEVVCLSSQEKKAVIEAVVKANKSKLPLVVGIGGNNTAKVVEEIKETDLTP